MNEQLIADVFDALCADELINARRLIDNAIDARQAVPFADLVSAYHQFCPKLAKVSVLSEPRKRALRVRWKEQPDLQWWEGYFKRISASPFLTGDNNQQWRATFDWILKPANLAKIVEGNYDPRPMRSNSGDDYITRMSRAAAG